MNENRWDEYINEILSFVKFKYDHREIRRELAEHMQDLKEDLMEEGMDEAAAEYMTVEYMGEAAEIGQELDKEHHAVLGWIWRVTRTLAILLIVVNILPMITFVGGMFSNLFSEYEPPEDVAEVWHMELDREYQIYDDTLILGDIYYYEDGMMDVVYRTKRNPFARSIDWTLSIYLGIWDAEENDIRKGGGGFKQGGYYGFGVDHLDEVPPDAKTLKIYCSDLVITVDLETGEVMDNEA